MQGLLQGRKLVFNLTGQVSSRLDEIQAAILRGQAPASGRLERSAAPSRPQLR